MKAVGLLGPLLLCIALISCGLGGPSPEDAQEIAALQQELEQVRSEIAAANNKNATLSGGAGGSNPSLDTKLRDSLN